MKNRFLFLVVFSLLLVASSVVMAEDVIKIGVFEPMTGPFAVGGELSMMGYKLAQEHNPTVLGKKVELIVVDNKSDKVEAANAVERLINNHKVVAILGSYSSGLSIPGGEVADKAGIPMLTATATNPLVTMGKDYVFRACFIDPFQGSAVAKYAYNNLGLRKAALLVDVAQDYSVGLANFFKKTFEKLGGEIVTNLKYQTGDQDFSAQMTEIINSGAEVLFFPGYFGDVALIAIQGRELGFKGAYMGGDTLDNPKLLEIAKEHAEGVVATSFYHPEAPATTEISINFVKSFKEKYGENPNAVSVMTYDAYNLLLDAIERAGSTDPNAIRDALAATEGFVGAAGTITIDENGDAIRPAVVLKVKDGAFHYEATINP
ncbi:MAG: branched-chain amino acid transport system substrate-binding protein [Halanaerobiales bacterium]|nr:branched-chain amino acid transport system substrate-binding protein [Halanaerobiales bacterium]